MKNAIQDPNAEIEDIERLVGEALEHAGAGGAVNLSDLDDRANRLCEYLFGASRVGSATLRGSTRKPDRPDECAGRCNGREL